MWPLESALMFPALQLEIISIANSSFICSFPLPEVMKERHTEECRLVIMGDETPAHKARQHQISFGQGERGAS